MTLTFYICSRFLRSFSWALLAILFLILLIDGSDQINFMANKNIEFLEGVRSTLLRTPSIMIDAMPLVIMLAGLTTFLNLARNSELVVIRSAGRSVLRILFAPTILTIVIGILCTSLGNPIVSSSLKYSEEFLQNLGLKPRKFMSVTGNEIWLRETSQDKQTVIKASQTNFQARTLFDLTIFEFDGEDVLTRRISAEEGHLLSKHWELKNVLVWTLDLDGPSENAFKLEKLDTFKIRTNISETQILDSFSDPKAINFWKTPNFINKLEASGFSARRHKIFYLSEISRPLFFVAMLLIGASFALRQARFGQTSILIMLSIATGFILFSIKRIAESLGAAGEIPLFLATFGPSISGILLATGLLLHFEDG